MTNDEPKTRHLSRDELWRMLRDEHGPNATLVPQELKATLRARSEPVVASRSCEPVTQPEVHPPHSREFASSSASDRKFASSSASDRKFASSSASDRKFASSSASDRKFASSSASDRKFASSSASDRKFAFERVGTSVSTPRLKWGKLPAVKAAFERLCATLRTSPALVTRVGVGILVAGCAWWVGLRPPPPSNVSAKSLLALAPAASSSPQESTKASVVPSSPGVAAPPPSVRAAVDLLLAGRNREALDAYRALSLANPSERAFAEIAGQLERELASCGTESTPCVR